MKLFAAELLLGDVIALPGQEVHDDLAGLIVSIKVEDYDHIQDENFICTQVVVTHNEGKSRSYFLPDEEVEVTSREVE